ncbi:MAG: MFS transporter, partial [Actinomycetota bacterium]|nr:MFS transporter [Actinomycetota bacterium]
GWSAGLVAGSTLLAESVPSTVRTRVQGTSDLVMNLVGAAGGALSGVALGQIGFGGLNAVAAALILPTVLFSVRAARQRR